MQPIPGCTNEPLVFQYTELNVIFTGPGGEKLVTAEVKCYVETSPLNTNNSGQNSQFFQIKRRRIDK